MSIKINRLEEGHNSYPLVWRRPAETVSLQRRQICYRWGTPAYWSLVPRSSMFYLFEFCLKNMWNCSLTQHILSHSFYDWKLYELFLLSGFLICHAVGWYKIVRMWGWNFTRNNIPISCYPVLKLPTNYVCYELFLKWIHKSKRFTSKRTILIGKHQQYKHKGSTKRNISNKIPDRTNNHGFFYFSRKKSYHVGAYENKNGWLVAVLVNTINMFLTENHLIHIPVIVAAKCFIGVR
jgi:hypothetical protein